MKKTLEMITTTLSIGFGLFILYFGFKMLYITFEQIFK